MKNISDGILKQIIMIVDILKQFIKIPGAIHLRNVKCDIQLHGRYSAEINYSSTVSHLGTGASWTITYHFIKLLERQHTHYNKLCVYEDEANIYNKEFKSKFEANIRKEDILAKLSLSCHYYIPYWLTSLKMIMKY